MKYKIITYGCQMNAHDSERIAFLLEQMGYTPTEERDDADLILYNTCLVRENAELKVYGQLGSLKHWKTERPGRILAVSGCMMQTGPAREVIRDKYRHVDLIFGTKNIGKLPQLLSRVQQTGDRVIDIDAYEDDDQLIFDRQSDRFAYINIMTGCNNYCTYCIVPFARGREESREASSILKEAEALAARGYKEIMLLGQNVNSYHSPDGTDFPELLSKIDAIEGLERIRFMSSHPKDLSDALIDVMACSKKIENHFHLPLQSGSNKVLKEMNRRYTREHYMKLVEKLREKMPSISISTDIIVGFPGETEEDHKETLDLCRQVRFDTAFTFLYSPRPGTGAARREDQIPEEIAGRRFQELLDVLYPIFLEKNQQEIGRTARVLLESVSKTDPNRLTGHDEKGKLVHVQADASLIGEMVDVKIVDCTSFALEGEMIPS